VTREIEARFLDPEALELAGLGRRDLLGLEEPVDLQVVAFRDVAGAHGLRREHAAEREPLEPVGPSAPRHAPESSTTVPW